MTKKANKNGGVLVKLDEAAITKYITDTFVGVDVTVADDNTFFIYDPGHKLPAEQRFPFATLVTNDLYDRVSNLSRPDVFRLNIGVSKATYLCLFGEPAGRPDPDGVVNTGHDFTALDQLMPHPVYAQMFWICVLNPGTATSVKLKSLLAEAYEISVARLAKRY